MKDDERESRKRDLEILKKHFIDDVLDGRATKETAAEFISALCNQFGYEYKTEDQSEINCVIEDAVHINTEYLIEQLVDPWNELQDLKPVLSELEYKCLCEIQDIMDDNWDSDLLLMRLLEGIEKLKGPENHESLGEEAALWLAEITRIADSHRNNILNPFNYILTPSLS